MSNSEIKMKFSLDSSGVKNGIRRAKKSISDFSSSAVGSLARVAGAFAGLGLIKNIVSLGTAAAETASKFDAVFKGAAGRMNEEVQKLRETIPSTTAEMRNALATFAQMAKAFGLNEEASNLFSVQMVKIAGDIASFNNLPIEEAFGKIQSAVSGEFEPLKQLGIVINETILKQEALSLAIWDGTGQMSAAQKAIAVQSILIRDMGDANGDAAATAESAANQIKFLKAELKETGTEIGETMLPGIVELTKGLSELLKITKKVTDFIGTQAGEMLFGPTDETLERIDKADRARQAELQAMKELTAEGKLYKQGMFEGTLWTEGLSEKLEQNKRLIEERKSAILEANAASESTIKNETAELETRNAVEEDAIEITKDLTAAIEEQIAAETDPARKKAYEDQLAAMRKLIEAAGELPSMQPAKPGTTSGGSTGDSTGKPNGKTTSGGTSGGSSMEGLPGDTNSSGYVTPREQRALERAQRAADTERRRKERDERLAEAGANERNRRKQRDERMSAREAAAGSGPGADKTPSGMSADDKKDSKASEETKTELKEQTKLLTTIKEEIQKNP